MDNRFRFLRRLGALSFPPFTVPVFLLLLCLAAYGLLIPWLGFFWDDLPITWIFSQLGPEGLQRYYSIDRPVLWGLYQLTTPLLGDVPWRWHLFALLMRWLSGVALWGLLRLAWPRQPEAALWAAALFVVYPGFKQQYVSNAFGHYFLLQGIFFFSLQCTLRAVRRPRRFWPYTLLALAASAVHLFSLEYFFLLDLLRPLLVWVVLSEGRAAWPARLRRTIFIWLPYLAVFIGAAVWRTVIFGFNTYQPQLIQDLRADTGAALPRLAEIVLSSIGTASLRAWAEVFRLPEIAVLGLRTTLLYALIVAAVLVLSGFYLSKACQDEDCILPEQRGAAWPLLGLGLIGLLLAGGPFWLTGLPVGLTFSNDRFTLPFMLGVSLALAALLRLLPARRGVKLLLVAVAVGFAAGHHFQNGISYQRDWKIQRSFFWQMSWRIPALAPGTAIIADDLPFRYYTDNSLVAPLNWTYAPDYRDITAPMPYIFFDPEVRLGRALPELEKGLEIVQDYRAAKFYGSTSQMIGVVYRPPACLRILDPELDVDNWMLAPVMRQAAAISEPAAVILPAGEAARPPAQIYGREPAPDSWCYYFQKADLARQQGDWQSVVELAGQAFALGDYPNDPVERLPFIEGYAHQGDWQAALALSDEAGQITPLMQPVLCRLWQRIQRQTPASPAQVQAVTQALSGLECQEAE